MNHPELSIKTTINDLETKLDKNFNPYSEILIFNIKGLASHYFFNHESK